MIILANDPGASAGWVVLDTEGPRLIYAGALYDGTEVDELIQESQVPLTHIFRNGRRVRVARKSQQTLSFTAGRLFEAAIAERKYRIEPNAWRAILWPGRAIPKKVVIARLKAAYPEWTAGHTDDVIEAIGIAVAWSKLDPKTKERYRVVD